MAKLIVKSPYIKCTGGGNAAGAGGYLHYIGTREHVQRRAFASAGRRVSKM